MREGDKPGDRSATSRKERRQMRAKRKEKTRMELERILDEQLHQVSGGGLTEARQQELDDFIQRCQNSGISLETALNMLAKHGGHLEECVYVREHW